MDTLSGAVELLAGAIRYMLGVCAPIGPAEMTLPTPCADWDLAMLLGHLCQSMADLETALRTGRLDLPSDHIRAARDAGVRFAIDSDAHSVSDLGNMPYGAGTAQRGWLTPDDVINTWPLDRLRAFLRKGR